MPWSIIVLMLPGGDIREHNVCFLSYADDTKLNIIFTSAESNDAAAIDLLLIIC